MTSPDEVKQLAFFLTSEERKNPLIEPKEGPGPGDYETSIKILKPTKP